MSEFLNGLKCYLQLMDTEMLSKPYDAAGGNQVGYD